MDVTRYVAIALILAAGGTLQSAAGFGYALLSVTLLMLLGVALLVVLATYMVCQPLLSQLQAAP